MIFNVNSVDSEQEATAKRPTRGIAEGALRFNGFSLVAAWHFLVIHSAIFNPSSYFEAGRFFWLQLALYVSLALSYLIIGMCGSMYRKLFSGRNQVGMLVTLVLFSAVACIGTLVTAFSPAIPEDFLIFCYIGLGIGTALLVFPWLINPLDSASGLSVFRNMVFNMGIGSLIAFVITFMPRPYCFAIICLLPFISNTIYILEMQEQRQFGRQFAPWTETMEEQNELKISDMTAPCILFFLYSTVFGFCQGCFSSSTTGDVSWVLNDGWPILGATFSAIVLMFVPKKYLERYGLMTIQQASMVIMFIGVFVTLFFTTGAQDYSPAVTWIGDKAGQAIAYAGFNVFEFGFMIFAFAWATKLGSNLIPFVGVNRGMLYSGMALGLMLGFTLKNVIGSSMSFYLLCGAIVVLALTVFLMPFIRDLIPYDMWPNDEVGELDGPSIDVKPIVVETEIEDVEAEEESVDHWQIAINNLADQYKLSRREREVFTYLARGRNAAFIQQELYISIHTVKTHIANIYRKLEVHSIQEVLDIVEDSIQKMA